MPLSRTSDRTKIQDRINTVRTDRESPIERIEQFDGPTLFYNDDDTGSLFAFTKRRDFLFWSWASSVNVPTIRQLQTALTLMYADKESEYSALLPFSGIFSENCPWAQKFVLKNKDTTVVDNIVAAMNLITPNSAFRVDPPQAIALNRVNSVVDFGLVWGLTLPFRVDIGDDNQKQDFEIKTRSALGGGTSRG